MNCTDFQQRMQQLIDDRMALAVDEELSQHALLCDSCCADMQTWQQIESVFADADDQDLAEVTTAAGTANRFPGGMGLSLVAAAAAVFLLVIVSASFKRDGETRVAQVPAVVQDNVADVQVDPVQWWQNVQQRDWIGQTMPAVQSVRDGVAPLGRSFIQAVAILTTSGGAQTS